MKVFKIPSNVIKHYIYNKYNKTMIINKIGEIQQAIKYIHNKTTYNIIQILSNIHTHHFKFQYIIAISHELPLDKHHV